MNLFSRKLDSYMRVVQSKFRQMETFVTSLALSSFYPSSNNHPSRTPKQHSKHAEHRPLHSTLLSSHEFSTLVIICKQRCYFQSGKPLCPDSWDHGQSNRPFGFSSFLCSPLQLRFQCSQLWSLSKTQINNRRHLESHMLSCVGVE